MYMCFKSYWQRLAVSLPVTITHFFPPLILFSFVLDWFKQEADTKSTKNHFNPRVP